MKEIPSEEFEYPLEKILYVEGSHFVYRFVAEASGTLIILPKILDIHERKWLADRDYGWEKRKWLKECAGCHTTGFSSDGDNFVETGVGCEACHGPSLNHAKTRSTDFVINPAKLSADRREMICESCHTSGIDNSGQYHFPIGFRPGDDLTKFYVGLTPKPGQDGTTFFGDESYEDRRRQWEFLKSRLFLAKGLTCDYCKDFRNVPTTSGSDYFTYDQYCLTCHRDRRSHPSDNPGTGCTGCHKPMLNASGTAFSIHDHRFSFEKPGGK